MQILKFIFPSKTEGQRATMFEYARIFSIVTQKLALAFCFNISFLVLTAQKKAINEKEDKKNCSISVQELITLKSGDLILNINCNNGLPYNYCLKGNIIWGEDSGRKINVIICRLHPRNYFTISIAPSIIKTTAAEADVFFNVAHETRPAVAFHIKYVLQHAALIITMEQVTEQSGYELIEAALPDLATVRQESGNGWFAHSLGGGAVVDLNNKNVHEYALPDDENFGSIGYVLPVAMVGTSRTVCTMEVSAFMDGIKMEIVGSNHHLHARIGTVQVYRVHGGRSYNMNNGGEAVKGNDSTPNLLIGQPSHCRLDFAGDYDSSGIVDWLDGAKIIAERMPASTTNYFNDKFIYLIGGKYKSEKEPRTTFLQSEKLIKDIAMLTDYAPQVPLISGWVYDGQDTGFPSEDSVNETLGGYTGLKNLLVQGPKYNANISFNTNYDDAYKSSPLFDTAFIARRPDGKIWRSRDWAGEYSYIVGMAKYMKHYGIKRIDYMMDHYKIHEVILIDAMSWFAIRNDWDIHNPASGYKNLVDGKYKIIDEFEKKGVHVISEQLRYPFIGKLAVTADGVGGGTCPFGGEPIPLLAAIYRKAAIWGTGDFSPNDTQRNLFWNCRSIQWYTNASDRVSITDFYYLTVLPFNKIHNLSIESYNRNGFHSTIGFSNGSSIENDWISQDYSIKLNRVEIAGHGATFCPLDEDRIACYSRNGQEIAVDLPKNWDIRFLTVRALFTDHREPFHFEIKNDKIIINAPPARPIIIYRNAAIADTLR